MKVYNILVLFIALVCILVLSGCQLISAMAPAATPMPTYTPYPTFTAYPTATLFPTIAPTEPKLQPSATTRPTAKPTVMPYVPPASTQAPVIPTEEKESDLKLDTTLKVINQCSEAITMYVTGPMDFKVTSQPGTTTELTIAKGTYSYTSSVGVSGSYELNVAIWEWTWCP